MSDALEVDTISCESKGVELSAPASMLQSSAKMLATNATNEECIKASKLRHPERHQHVVERVAINEKESCIIDVSHSLRALVNCLKELSRALLAARLGTQ